VSKTIEIKKPEIIKQENGKVRLVTNIIKDDKFKELWVEADSEFEKYMVTENCDAALCFFFVMAMRRGYDIVCEAPVSERLLFNLHEMAKVAYKYTKDLHLPKIQAKVCQNLKNEGAVVTSGSLGVNSFYAIDKFIDTPYSSLKLTHLWHNDVLEFSELKNHHINQGKRAEQAQQFSDVAKAVQRENLKKVAKELGVIPCFFDTNIATISSNTIQYNFFANNCFVGYSFAKLFGTIIVPSKFSIASFGIKHIFRWDNGYHELLNLSMLSSVDSNGGIRFIGDTFVYDRLDKIKVLADNHLVRQYLNVCLATKDGTACNLCSKCKRTLIMLDYLDKLDNFAAVFDIEYYKNNFEKSYKPFLTDGINLKMILNYDLDKYQKLLDTLIKKHN